MSLYDSIGDSVSGYIESAESFISPLTNAIGDLQDMFFPNKNTTDTRKRFNIDASEWNTPKLNFQFYVLFYINDFVTIQKSITSTITEQKTISMQSQYGDASTSALEDEYDAVTYTEDGTATGTREVEVTDIVNAVSDYNDYNEGLFAKFNPETNQKVRNNYYKDAINALANAQGLADDMSKWVISCTRPSWATEFTEFNQYNRKRLVPSKTSYVPITMNVWDDVASHVAKLLTLQLSIADNSFFSKSQQDFDQFTQLDRFMSNWNEWGLNVYSGVSVFKMIQIVEIWQNKVTAYTIHNPKLVKVEMSQHDLSVASQGMGFNLTFDYEGFTISNPADSEIWQPLMGNKITKDLAKKCRMQYISRFDQLMNSAAGLINNLATGKSVSSTLKDFGTSMGYGQVIGAVDTAVNTVRNIIPAHKNKESTLKTAGSAAACVGQAAVNFASFEG